MLLIGAPDRLPGSVYSENLKAFMYIDIFPKRIASMASLVSATALAKALAALILLLIC